jgi:hypothetical protein
MMLWMLYKRQFYSGVEQNSVDKIVGSSGKAHLKRRNHVLNVYMARKLSICRGISDVFQR